MIDFQAEFEEFMTDYLVRTKDLGITLTDYPLDHVCYRAEEKDYAKIHSSFREVCRLFTERI